MNVLEEAYRSLAGMVLVANLSEAMLRQLAQLAELRWYDAGGAVCPSFNRACYGCHGPAARPVKLWKI